MDEQDDRDEMVMMRSSFPVTGQPIRVVMINDEPWFVIADVCKILGRENPTRTKSIVDPGQSRVVNLRAVTLTFGKAKDSSAGGKPYERGNPMTNVVSESGLYTLIMRSNKPTALPFQRWVTEELLPSIRRGDTDVPKQQQRMAETLSEAIGQQVQILAEIQQGDGGPGVHVRSDGTVHCRHGEMEFRVPSRDEDSGPPFGAYFQCPSVERVGIRGGTALPRCARLKLVDLIRRLARPPAAPEPSPAGGLLEWDVSSNRVRATAQDLADLLRKMGQQPE
ncbi:BRO-N domain-containing protein [Kitasatospora sp. McL0602]|uniref:BRO-N domain-containing protein n=1 Tax=Kitasatospora sp. McL0602 TaxID=3439530 RepID=UPI003F89AF1D